MAFHLILITSFLDQSHNWSPPSRFIPSPSLPTIPPQSIFIVDRVSLVIHKSIFLLFPYLHSIRDSPQPEESSIPIVPCDGASPHLSNLVSSLYTHGWFSSHRKILGDPQLFLLFLVSMLPHMLFSLSRILFLLLVASFSAYSGITSSRRPSPARLSWFTCISSQ